MPLCALSLERRTQGLEVGKREGKECSRAHRFLPSRAALVVSLSVLFPASRARSSICHIKRRDTDIFLLLFRVLAPSLLQTELASVRPSLRPLSPASYRNSLLISFSDLSSSFSQPVRHSMCKRLEVSFPIILLENRSSSTHR